MAERDSFKHLRELEPNWDSYGGVPITEAALATAEKLRNAFCWVPMSDGGIQVEVHAAGIEFDVEIGPDGTCDSLLVERARERGEQ